MKNCTELFSILRSNPVGFLKLNFKGNMNFEELESWDPEEKGNKIEVLSLELFEGINSLGTFIIKWDDIDEIGILSDDESLTPSMGISGIIESNFSKMRLYIRLDFPICGGGCGECYIYEYEEEKTNKEIKDKTISLIDPVEIEKLRLAKIRRNWKYVFIFLGVLSIVYAFSYCATRFGWHISL